MAEKRIIIAGGGLSGLSVAWHLQHKGVDCHVLEKEHQEGGLCRSKNINGFSFDYDGHLLHFKCAYTFNFIRYLLGDNLIEHKRNAWVYSKGKYTRYPFQANLYGLPSSVVKECLCGFIRAKGESSHGKNGKLNFFEWIHKTFGRGIARHFMIPYNTKFWSVPLRELTCEWLDGFIPVPSLTQIIEGTIEESRRLYGYNARFWYPKRGGINQVPKELVRRIKNIHTCCKVTGIDLKNKCVEINGKKAERFDLLVSTIPLPEMGRIVSDIPYKIRRLFERLRWNSIFNLNLGTEKKDPSGRHWVYFPDRQICFFRVGFPHNFSCSGSRKKMSLYAEVAYSKTRGIDKRRIVSRIKKDLEKTGILNRKDEIIAQDINDIKYGYPVYDTYHHRAVSGILEYMAERDVFSCGRYGSWRYMSMEDVIIEAKHTADLLLKNV